MTNSLNWSPVSLGPRSSVRSECNRIIERAQLLPGPCEHLPAPTLRPLRLLLLLLVAQVLRGRRRGRPIGGRAERGRRQRGDLTRRRRRKRRTSLIAVTTTKSRPVILDYELIRDGPEDRPTCGIRHRQFARRCFDLRHWCR